MRSHDHVTDIFDYKAVLAEQRFYELYTMSQKKCTKFETV